jgi:hypothetical protein
MTAPAQAISEALWKTASSFPPEERPAQVKAALEQHLEMLQQSGGSTEMQAPLVEALESLLLEN